MGAVNEQDSAAGDDQQQHDQKKKRKQRRVAPLEENEGAGAPAGKPSPAKKQRRAARLQQASAPDTGAAEAELDPLRAPAAEVARAPETADATGTRQDGSDDDDAPEEVHAQLSCQVHACSIWLPAVGLISPRRLEQL